MSIIIAGDSRAVGLAQLVTDSLKGNRYYKIYKFADTGRSISRIKNAVDIEMSMEGKSYDGVIFLAGCCDVTEKQYIRGKRNIYFPHRDSATCRAVVSVRLSNMVRQLTSSYPETKMSVCTIYGRDLQRFNQKQQRDPKQQWLDDSIKLLKQDIMLLNRLNGVPTCKLHKVFHRNRYSRNKKGRGTNAKSRHVCQYGKEKMRDGCHPNKDTQMIIASKIAETIKSMFPVPLVYDQDDLDTLMARNDPDCEMQDVDELEVTEDEVTEQIRRITVG